jgi:FMN phosphatase YigB (HAD superfamily)
MGFGIVFDLDEILLDRKGSLTLYARQLWSSFSSETTYEAREFVEIFHKYDRHGRAPRLEFFRNLQEDAFPELNPSDIGSHFYAHVWSHPILFENVIIVFEAFKSKSYRIGVVTNGSVQSQKAKIIYSGIAEHLDATIISEEFGANKPDRTIYEEIAKKLDIEPISSWFVGDDPVSDVWGPVQCGFNAAWIERYLPWPEDKERCYKHKVHHVSELVDLLPDRA